jgi:type I restriction enzyme R subunit
MKTYSRHDFTREERAARAKVAISAAFESKEQAFLDFVLSHYAVLACRNSTKKN